MSAAAQQMVTNLNEQIGVYRRLLDLTRAQVVALQGGQVRMVHALLQEIEVTMLDRAGVERGRDALITLLSSELGVAYEAVTASLLRERCGGEVGDAIDAAAAQLKLLVQELSIATAQSRALLEGELHIVQMLVRGMTDSGERPTYSKYGTQADQAPRKLLDMQV